MLSVGNFVGVSICQKLHENERNWTESGGGGVPGAPWIRHWFAQLKSCMDPCMSESHYS